MCVCENTGKMYSIFFALPVLLVLFNPRDVTEGRESGVGGTSTRSTAKVDQHQNDLSLRRNAAIFGQAIHERK